MSLREAKEKYGWLVKGKLTRMDKVFAVAEMWRSQLERLSVWLDILKEAIKTVDKLAYEYVELTEKISKYHKDKRVPPNDLKEALDTWESRVRGEVGKKVYAELKVKAIEKRVGFLETLLIHYYPKAATMLGKTAVERGENGKTRITVPKGTKKVKVKL